MLAEDADVIREDARIRREKHEREMLESRVSARVAEELKARARDSSKAIRAEDAAYFRTVNGRGGATTIVDAPPGKRVVRKKRQIAVRNPAEVILYSRCLIAALEPALNYDPSFLPNEPPPYLWKDDVTYLQELRALVAELRQLNELLKQIKGARSKPARKAIDLRKHLDKFLESYATKLGDAAGYATVGLIACLICHLGGDKHLLAKLFENLSPPD